MTTKRYAAILPLFLQHCVTFDASESRRRVSHCPPGRASAYARAEHGVDPAPQAPDHPHFLSVQVLLRGHAAREVAGIEEFRFHDLRHTCASYPASQGVSILEIAAVLNHRTTAMNNALAAMPRTILEQVLPPRLAAPNSRGARIDYRPARTGRDPHAKPTLLPPSRDITAL